MNDQIRAPQIRVLDDDGNALGVMTNTEALRIAISRGMDLVEISSASKPPVCKIVDYGKFNYERQKKEKLAKKNQHVMNIKEIRFNPNTDTHDIDFKTKHLRQFLIDGHKVKAYVMFKGRMITHPEIGRKLMDDIVEKLNDIAKLESPPRMEGKQLFAYFLPDKVKIQSYKDSLKKEKKAENKADKKEVISEEKNKTDDKEDA
ncbi:MAG: translation initiation factor IF-3 [Bacteroidetes bacterium]|nr:translation initiation factor IF-3 [Bacteroidota bacterium]